MPELKDKLQWRNWLNQEETQTFFQDLESMRNDLKEAWASGGFTERTVSETAQLNARALGQVQILDAILDLRTERMEQDEQSA